MAKKDKTSQPKKSKPISVTRAEPFGRPTKYEPRFCSMLIEHMTGGLSFESFSGIADVTVSTLYEWEKAQPDFSEAKNRAFGKNLLYWEKIGQDGLWDETHYDSITGKPTHKKSLNSAVWIFSMKNRHKWKDRQEVDTTIQHHDGDLVERERLRQLSLSELENLVKKSLPKRRKGAN